MTRQIMFTVQGNAVPKQSFRYKSGRGKQGQLLSYQSPRVDAWEVAVGYAAKQAMRGDEPITGKLRVVLHFYLSHMRIVDVDNLMKCVCDGCRGIVFKDDNQIIDAHIVKQQVRGGIAETRVWIEEVESAIDALERD